MPQLSSSPSPSIILTQNLKNFRTVITPYLPPPIIKLISTTNEYLKPYTDEGFMIIIFTALICYIVYILLCVVKRLFQSRYSVLNDDDDDVMGLLSKNNKNKKVVNVDISSTILLCGISGSGKTLLFHKLSQLQATEEEEDSIPSLVTVPSLKAAEEYVTCTSTATTNNDKASSTSATIRLIDFPGHASLRSSIPLSITNKIIFLLDSSKSITESAHFLFHILTTTTPSKQQGQILIVCNKEDLPLAKNLKRIKLQLRTELERLRKVKVASTLDHDGMNDDSNNSVLVLPKNSIDLDTCDGLQYKLSFVQSSSISLNHEGFHEIKDFVFN